MLKVEADMRSAIADVTSAGFAAFSEHIAGMFGVEATAAVEPSCMETVGGLAKRFKKLAAVASVNGEGALNGTFHVLFDQGGLFTLSGIVMMLPENRIEEVIRKGSREEAQNMRDAIAELGNMIMGTWDRVFREALGKRHRHFKQAGVFIGKPWDNAEEVLGIGAEEEFLFIPATMSVGAYPEFTCGVLLPPNVFAAADEDDESADHDAAAEAVEGGEVSQEPARDDNGMPDAAEGEAAEPDEAPADESAQEPADTGASADDETGAAADESVSPWPTDALRALTAQQIMQKDVAWLTPADTVQDAINTMQRYATGYLMIGSDGVLEGIVSRSDAAGAVSPYLRPAFAQWKRPLDDATLQIKLLWVMTRPVRTITPQTPLDVIVDTMLHFGGRCLPVVDQAGAVRGMVTAFDILKVLATGREMPHADSTAQAAASGQARPATCDV